MPKPILIGSMALQQYIPGIRSPKDADFAVWEADNSPFSIPFKTVEELVIPVLFEEKYSSYTEGLWHGIYDILTLKGLFLLKLSHIFYDVNWWKHAKDLQTILKQELLPLLPLDLEFLQALREHWEAHYSSIKVRRSNLKQSKEDFFTNLVNPNIDSHDQLHECLNPYPLYKQVLKDGAEVELDEEKYTALPLEKKVALMQEEIYVMAFERFSLSNPIGGYRKMCAQFFRKHIPEFALLDGLQHLETVAAFDLSTFSSLLKNARERNLI